MRWQIALLAVTVLYLTSTNEIHVFLKTTKTYLKICQNITKKCAYTYMSSYTMACEPIKAQELQHTIASFY